MAEFDRYTPFKVNGKVEIVPFIKIRKKDTDKYIEFDKRCDKFEI